MEDQHLKKLKTKQAENERLISFLQQQLQARKHEKKRLRRQIKQTQLEKRFNVSIPVFVNFRDQMRWVYMQVQRIWRDEGFVALASAGVKSFGLLIVLFIRAFFNSNGLGIIDKIFYFSRSSRISREDGHLPVLSMEYPAYHGRQRIRAFDVIIFSIIDWDFRFQRPQQIALQFAKEGHRVFYICTTFHAGKHPDIYPIQDGVYEVHLPGIPSVNIYQNQINNQLEEMAVNAIALLRKEFGMINVTSIVGLPFWGPVVFRLREKFGWKVVYDCMDYHAGFPGSTEQMSREEQTLSRGSDLVLATSHSLFAKEVQVNPKCILVPNATDFDHFHFIRSDTAEELKDLKKPIIGYYGAIAEWFDSELVSSLARAKPQWSFVLIGSTFTVDLKPLEGVKNVHLLGEKPYAILPQYLHAFDVCIIPFKKTLLTEATNPVKVFEFLSAGKAVVATRLEELQHYSDYVELASGKEEWLKKIEQAMNDYSPEKVAARIDFARSNTWEERYAQILQGIFPLYPKVSIILVTYNNLKYTKLCLNSIFSKTLYPNFEIIIVDNNSTDGTREYLDILAARNSNVTLILNNTNEGFARANNKGIKASTGEYVIFLNNDTIVTIGWITRLLRHLEDETVGMVGPVTNFCGNEAKIEVPYTKPDEIEGFAENYLRDHPEPSSFDIKVLAMYCLAMKKKIIEEVGSLDERFGIGMFEDDDYAHRVRLKGHRVICAEDVFIHHFGEASFSKLKISGEYTKLFEENKRRFEEKWGVKWEPHKHRME
jgi:GT2 family glycosyltransferase/glycosyltransferase involved in cell wall biosynthesis